MPREPSKSTLSLRSNFDNFLREFEEEFQAQARKGNMASERRMRKLLRSFQSRVYVPYRDETLSD